MLNRLPRFALAMGTALRPWLVLCALAGATLSGCQLGKPAANCVTGTAAGSGGVLGHGGDGPACGRGPWFLFAHREVDVGPVRSPFLPVPTYNVYHYAAAPLTVVPMSPVPNGPPAPPVVVEPHSEGGVNAVPPGTPLPAPWRETPTEPLLRSDDAQPYDGRTTNAQGEPPIVKAAAMSSAKSESGNILRLRAETLESQPSAAAND